MNKKQKECEHEKVVGTETYGVYGYYDKEDKTIHLKQGDGGLNDDLECEDCGFKMGDYNVEFN